MQRWGQLLKANLLPVITFTKEAEERKELLLMKVYPCTLKHIFSQHNSYTSLKVTKLSMNGGSSTHSQLFQDVYFAVFLHFIYILLTSMIFV